MKKKFLAGIIAASFLLSGCNEEVAVQKSPVVKVKQIESSNAAQEEKFSGVVRGRYETNLAFQVGGKIISRDVQAGSIVRAGEVLMTIDPKDIVEQSRSSDAQVVAARAQLELARNNLERYTELFKSEAIAAAILDQ